MLTTVVSVGRLKRNEEENKRINYDSAESAKMRDSKKMN